MFTSLLNNGDLYNLRSSSCGATESSLEMARQTTSTAEREKCACASVALGDTIQKQRQTGRLYIDLGQLRKFLRTTESEFIGSE
jgi:hypothetical protein